MQPETKQETELMLAQRINDIATRTKCKPKVRDFMEHILFYDRGSIASDIWVKVALRLLETSHENSSARLRQLLASLPHSVQAIYDRFLCSIPLDRRWVACKTLLIVIGSRRPLTSGELHLLLAIRQCHKTTEDLKVAYERGSKLDLQQLLGPLIQIRNGAVEIIDQSVKRYLLYLADKTENDLSIFFGIRETEPDQVLAEACMSYLLLEDIGNSFHKVVETDCSVSSIPTETRKSDNELNNTFDAPGDTKSQDRATRLATATRELISRFDLFDYASRNWASHLSKFSHDGAVALFPLAKTLCEPRSSILHSWLTNYWTETHPDIECPYNAGPVFLASFFGHPVSLQLYLKGNINRRELEISLYWASRNGHYIIVMLLLQKSIEPNTAVIGKFPQHAAAEFGHARVLKMFLAYRAIDMNVKYQGRTPISLAAEAGHIAAVTVLMSAHQVDPDLPDHDGMTALSWASINNHASCVTALLNSLRVQAWRTDMFGRTALSHAASRGHLGLVNLFLRAPGAGKDLPDVSGRTPLSHAAGSSHTSCVGALLRCPDVDAKALDKKGRSALSYAVEQGHIDTVRVLFAHSPRCGHVPDNEGRVPLAWASDAPPGKRAEVVLSIPTRRTMDAKQVRLRRAHSDSALDKIQMVGCPEVDGTVGSRECQRERQRRTYVALTANLSWIHD